MGLNRDYVGRSFPASDPYEVSRVKIKDFAIAIGDPNPAYLDPEAARVLGYPDVIAPPTFAIVVSFGMGGHVVGAPDLGLNYALVVHGEQSFSYSRPIHAGDVLVGTPTITDIRDAGRNELLTWEAVITTVDGEHVCTAVNTLVSRGTAEGARQ
ncbi:MAG TPA: MaoC family dehydratase N-terminal domain-containing protein [Mycobacteriales bacterium]|jgi:acyl dehydratase|nr:MaoC family dehydratase N-terminal domain-containing protein [Mycobacteriales bacterium]